MRAKVKASPQFWPKRRQFVDFEALLLRVRRLLFIGALPIANIMNRRNFFRLSAIGGLLLASGGIFASRSYASAYYKGPASDHFDGTRFFNPNGEQPNGFSDLMKWRFNGQRAEWPENYPSPLSDRETKRPRRRKGSARHLCWPRLVPHSDGGAEYSGRSGLVGAHKSVQLSGTKARQSTRHPLRGPAAD